MAMLRLHSEPRPRSGASFPQRPLQLEKQRGHHQLPWNPRGKSVPLLPPLHRDLFLARRFARHVSPLTTTVFTHPSDEEVWNNIKRLSC